MFPVLVLLIVVLCRRYKSYQEADRSSVIQLVTETYSIHLSLSGTSYTPPGSCPGWLLSKYPPPVINWSTPSSGFCHKTRSYDRSRKCQLSECRVQALGVCSQSWSDTRSVKSSRSGSMSCYNSFVFKTKIFKDLISEGSTEINGCVLTGS